MAEIRGRSDQTSRRGYIICEDPQTLDALAFSTLLSSQETSATPCDSLSRFARGDFFNLPRDFRPVKSAFTARI
jgi:hypothetical protein